MKMPDLKGRFPRNLLCLSFLFLLVSYLSGRQEAQGADNEPRPEMRDRLEWIWVATGESAESCGISLLFHGGEETSIRGHVRSGGVGPILFMPGERLYDNSLSYYQFRAPDCGPGELELEISEDSGQISHVNIPFSACNAADGLRNVIIPDCRLGISHPNPSFGWIRWTIEVGDWPVVRMTVLDANNQAVRSWPPNVMVPGRTAILWDGRDDRGQRVPSGTYTLSVEEETGKRIPAGSIRVG